MESILDKSNAVLGLTVGSRFSHQKKFKKSVPALPSRLSTYEEDDKPYVDQRQEEYFEFLIDSPRLQPHKEHSDTITSEVYDTKTTSQHRHHNHSCTTEP